MRHNESRNCMALHADTAALQKRKKKTKKKKNNVKANRMEVLQCQRLGGAAHHAINTPPPLPDASSTPHPSTFSSPQQTRVMCGAGESERTNKQTNKKRKHG